jgi:hypothetical protein
MKISIFTIKTTFDLIYSVHNNRFNEEPNHPLDYNRFSKNLIGNFDSDYFGKCFPSFHYLIMD